ncbi:hypothetical protein M422DRAFT_44489 [Sphaerobolus stellatus SS14]|nr:hypothetical protein M422DRAFT_44489 [Sphaerobolus stellatus SS14]
MIKCDSVVPLTLNQELVKVLENIPGRDKDWHPGSDNKVLDLVHPSLLPLIYGTSRILKDKLTTLDNCVELCGAGVTIPIPPQNKLQGHGRNVTRAGGFKSYSRKFQWIPYVVEVYE